MHVLAFEPFDAGSHRAVRESISRHSAHSWTWLTRPGKSWKWRMRTAAIEFAAMVREQSISCAASQLEAAKKATFVASEIDVLFVTSLMSASDLMALLPREFRSKPLVLYMHENQAAYPAGEAGEEPRDLHFLLTNIVSAAAADCVLFNSEWNRRSFFEGSATLLARHRDPRLRDVLPAIENKSLVVWPPVEVPSLSGFPSSPSPRGEGVGGGVLHKPKVYEAVRVVWPHRWEHDKGPAELLQIARMYSESHNLRLIVLGERYPRVPSELETFEKEFADRIDQFGFAEDRDTYWRWLSKADWVLSTAKHEFFGIAVVEALLAGAGGRGALPWLPERLSYEEILPACARGLSPMNPPVDAEGVRVAIRKHLEPALAVNAVRRIDEAVTEMIRTA